MGGVAAFLLTALLTSSAAVPVIQTQQPSMLNQFGPPQGTQQAAADSGKRPRGAACAHCADRFLRLSGEGYSYTGMF